MTKLSDIRHEKDAAEKGQWLFFGEDVYISVRRDSYRPYTRVVRRLQLERDPNLKAPGPGVMLSSQDIELRIAQEEREVEALHRARGELLIEDWCGWDMPGAEPVELTKDPVSGEALVGPTLVVVGDCDGTKVERWTCDGKSYRKLQDGKFLELLPYTPQKGAELLGDPLYEALRNWLAYCSDALTRVGVAKVLAIVGKSRTAPSGTPSTPTSPPSK